MIGSPVHNILKKVQLLAELDDGELSKIREICLIAEFPSGTTIMKAGETGSTMYFFLEGAVDVWPRGTTNLRKADSDLPTKPLVRLRAGTVSLFGEMAMLSNEPRSATITASSDCVLYEVSRDDFTLLCDQNPELGVKLLRGIANILANRVRKGNDDQIKLWKALSKNESADGAAHPGVSSNG